MNIRNRSRHIQSPFIVNERRLYRERPSSEYPLRFWGFLFAACTLAAILTAYFRDR